jgi:hypothetical protein
MWILHLALGLLALYTAIVAAMYLAQTWLLFPTAIARATRVRLPSAFAAAMRDALTRIEAASENRWDDGR